MISFNHSIIIEMGIHIANNVNANTHISVLLSTNNKNAHIQLVNHNSNVVHHITIQFLLSKSLIVIIPFFHFSSVNFLSSESSFFVRNNVNSWNIIAIQKIKTKLALILFIEIAILSEDNHNHQFVHHVSENMNVIN